MNREVTEGGDGRGILNDRELPVVINSKVIGTKYFLQQSVQLDHADFICKQVFCLAFFLNGKLNVFFMISQSETWHALKRNKTFLSRYFFLKCKFLS